METKYGGLTVNQLSDLLAGVEGAPTNIAGILGGGVNAIAVLRDLVAAAMGQAAGDGRRHAELFLPGTVTPQQAADVESPFNACRNREACLEMLVRERAAADMPSHGLDGRACEHCIDGHTELTFEGGKFSSNCDHCCADNDDAMVDRLNQLVENWLADQKGMPQPEPARTGVGVYCQPGDQRDPRWLLMFDDAERGACNYDSEHEARRMFAISEGNGWNCWLFSPTLRAFSANHFVGAVEAACVTVDRYVLIGSDPTNPTLIQRCPQAGGADKWKVQRMDECLNKQGEWEPEMLPSNRGNAYLSRCRYDSAKAAIEAAITSRQKESRAC